MFWGMLAGKMLKIFVWKIIFCQICVAGAITWKPYTQWYPNFLETVKKFANFLDMSATPEKSSITIRRSIFLLSPSKEFTSFSSGISCVLNLNVWINESRSSGSFAICTSVSLLKQDWILASLFLSMSILLIHSVFTRLPKNLLFRVFQEK